MESLCIAEHTVIPYLQPLVCSNMPTESLTSNSVVDLATSAVRAFQDGDYTAAVQYFTDLHKCDPDLWECRLYLGLAYSKLSRSSNAIRELKEVAEWCPDEYIKNKAVAALRAMKVHDIRPARH
jgi:Flp pilus assembly protein TadD